MAVRYTLLHSSNGATAELPTAAAINYAGGINVPSGPIDEFILVFNGTKNAAGDILGDFSNSISNLRLTLNGDQFFTFQAGYSTPATDQAGNLGYLLNSMGPGRSVSQVPLAAAAGTVSYFARVPCGRQAPNSTGRLEYSLSYSALAATMVNTTGAQFQIWGRYNDNYQTTVTVGQATTVNSAIATQQVVMTLPSGVPGTLAGFMIMDDRATDADLTSIQVISQSDYQMTTAYWRMINGDMNNGVLYANETISAAALVGGAAGVAVSSNNLQVVQFVPGCFFIPTYGLTLASDVRILCTFAAARAFQFLPIITAPAGSRTMGGQRQTQAVKSNVAQAVLDASDSLV